MVQSKTSALKESEAYFTSKWWLLTIRGIATILAGMAFVFWPGLTLVTLVYLFGAYILVNGVISLLDGLLGIGRVKSSHWVLVMLSGAVQLGVGIYLVRHPLVTFATLVLLIGLSLITLAVFETVAALAEKNVSITERTLSIIGSLAALLAGVFVLTQPAASGVAFVWILGVFALISGPIAIALSLDVKRLHEDLVATK
jgi:uncharacterized membrane protein HdeD (DUF308 family)